MGEARRLRQWVSARGRVIGVAGQIGWNKNSTFETDDFVGQVKPSLQKIVAARQRRRAPRAYRFDDLVLHQQARLSRQPKGVGQAYRETIGRHFRAMTAIAVSALIEDRAKVEIQAVAIVPDP
jgi:enamine deaminase RidA (YjgF/YER057c/UK114 family)